LLTDIYSNKNTYR